MADKKPPGLYYREYLRLDKILDAQELESERLGKPAHDEMLFIITHQAYELWFKQIVFEFQEIIRILSEDVVEDKKMGRILHLLNRVKTIQRVLIEQIEVIETITPLDFLEFRDLLVPASGFQSIMFKKIEIMMGIRKENRIPVDCAFFKTRLSYSDQEKLNAEEDKANLLELVDVWLQRAPLYQFEGFNFWESYNGAVDKMLDSDAKIIRENRTLSDDDKESQLGDLENTRSRQLIHALASASCRHGASNVGHQDWHRRIVRPWVSGSHHEEESCLYRFVQPFDLVNSSRRFTGIAQRSSQGTWFLLPWR